MQINIAILLVFLCLQSLPTASAQLADLTSDEYAALARATQASVTGTISFLASDELAGRGTPSAEFTIATAYVASRLRAAGAEGIGPEGSFFIESELATLRTPRAGLVLSSDNAPVAATLLNGAQAALEYRGTIPLVSEGQRYSGPAAMELGDSGGEEISRLMRLASVLRTQGATAILVLCNAGNPMWDVARRMQAAPRLAQFRRQWPLPIVIVDAQEWKAERSWRLTIPANVDDVTIVRNVAAVMRGSDLQLASEAIVFSAHLDHLGDGGSGPDPIYNGADDDASGVTAVLTLADCFGALTTPTARSLIFVTFWGEERGLLGSKAFVENSPWPLERIVANFNIEMIGRPEEGAENRMWMTGWQDSDLGLLAAQGSRRVGVETFEHPRYSAQLYRASDNYSFVAKGVVAHSFSAGSLHSDYHQPSDEWQKLDLAHMTQIIRGLYAAALPIAQGLTAPQRSK